MCAWFSHTLFICANFYPTWTTLVSASAILGFMSPLVWVTQGLYFSTISKQYAIVTHQNLQRVMGKFSSVLDQVESISILAGSGIAAGILHSEVYKYHSYTANNVTSLINNSEACSVAQNRDSHVSSDGSLTVEDRDIGVCGPNHCPYIDSHTAVLARHDQKLVYSLLATLLGCNLLGIFLTCFLTNITQDEGSNNQCEKAMQPLKLFTNRRLYLAIWVYGGTAFPKSIYIGAFQQVGLGQTQTS